MKKVVSISGGQTSAYLAANYPADDYVFALIRTSDKSCEFKDRKLAAKVEERIQMPFVGTLEDDVIINTIFDLEQYLGKAINWVSGITYDDVVKYKGGWLPNKLHRYCTTEMKIKPLFEWWQKKFNVPVQMMIGFRANEQSRAKRMLQKTNTNGILEYKAIVGKRGNQNKWGMVAWQKPVFPLIDDAIFKDDIQRYWMDKPVRFAKANNCVGCFHRSIGLLKAMSEINPEKLAWFAKQEGGKNGYWRSDLSYQKIIESNMQFTFDFEESGCDSGYCGIS